MANDPYENFAERYDWMKLNNPEREDFFRKLFKKHSISDVLDCACGTGIDLIMFHSLGCSVLGSDVSESMLTQARKNFSSAGLEIPIERIDYRELEKHYGTQFDSVVCLSNAISEVRKEREIHRALRSMKNVLRPGGILVLSQGQSDFTMKNPPKFDPVVNNRDFSRLYVLKYTKDVMKVDIFDFLHTEDRCQFYSASVDVAIILKDDWERLLLKAGFTKVEYFGDWNFTEYDKDSSLQLIIVAHK